MNKAKMNKLKIEQVKVGMKDLNYLLLLQKSFGKRFVDFDNLTDIEKTQWTKEFILCCQDELMEIMGWTSWKHWKKPVPLTDDDKLEIKFEIIDLLHFVLSLMLIWDMTRDDIINIYTAKMNENINRQKRGY